MKKGSWAKKRSRGPESAEVSRDGSPSTATVREKTSTHFGAIEYSLRLSFLSSGEAPSAHADRFFWPRESVPYHSFPSIG